MEFAPATCVPPHSSSAWKRRGGNSILPEKIVKTIGSILHHLVGQKHIGLITHDSMAFACVGMCVGRRRGRGRWLGIFRFTPFGKLRAHLSALLPFPPFPPFSPIFAPQIN